MSRNISSHVPDDVAAGIDAIAEYHDISASKAILLILLEGFHAREMRYRQEIIDAKLDVFIENFGVEEETQNKVESRLSEISNRSIPESTLGMELMDEPHPMLGPAGNLPSLPDVDIDPDQPTTDVGPTSDDD
ncbi:hypothetical protein G6M89_20665 [Natronolimnobius sp. AArcel1]|uniref:hypothetical protein n=1 Tax=Natronolimnobius sp. AArcel1 TaxID=1679093 RepID=UPI0013EBEA1B|nr:hypothetical protein [Natronolimnobius sp. AArcel1]NGM71377.1 hypothetical protein [Natronolimnobius sp. AArcel1]